MNSPHLMYLAGPYTSVTHQRKKHHIGRLYAWYVYSTITFHNKIVICFPLTTNGFEYLDSREDKYFLDMCCTFLREYKPQCMFVPGWESSKGCRIEHEIAESHGGYFHLEPASLHRQPVVQELERIAPYTPYAQWALDYMNNLTC